VQTVEVTVKTGKDTLGWDQSQARTYDATCRHTALTALAQLRTAAIRAGISGQAAVPATAPDTPAAGESNTAAAADNTANTADLQRGHRSKNSDCNTWQAGRWRS
jgi:hypothetical protein